MSQEPLKGNEYQRLKRHCSIRKSILTYIGIAPITTMLGRGLGKRNTPRSVSQIGLGMISLKPSLSELAHRPQSANNTKPSR